MEISAVEKGKIRALAVMAGRAGVDRLEMQELMEQAWRHGAAYCHSCPELSAPVRTVGTLAAMEREAILQAYAESDGDFRVACSRLGIGRMTLYRKLREYGVQHVASKGRTPRPECCPRCGFELESGEAAKGVAVGGAQ